MAADRVGRVGGGSQRIEDTLIQMIGVRTIGLRMHHELGHGDSTSAALGTQLVERDRFRPYATVVSDIRAAHRRGKHAVAECGAGQSDRLAQMRILLFKCSHMRKAPLRFV